MAKIQLSNVPRIDEGDLTDSQNIKRIMSYLYVLNEQLRYELTHIDDDNISQEGITTQAISQEALKRAIKDQMGSQTLDLSDNETIRQIQNRIDNMNKVQAQNSANITKMTNELGGKASKTNFEAFKNQVNALMSGLQSQISNNTTNIGTLQSDYNNHSHSLWSSSSDGSITIGIGNIRQGGTSTTFNIADTQFYKDGVSAVKLKNLSPSEGTYYPDYGVYTKITVNLTNGKTDSQYTYVPVTNPQGKTVTSFYPSSFEVTNVVKTSRGYTVYADVKVTVEYSDGTKDTSSAYQRSGSYYD